MAAFSGWAFVAVAAGYAALAVLLVTLGWRHRQSWLFAAAAATHGFWALSLVLPGLSWAVESILETAHYGVWAVFLGSILGRRHAGLFRAVLLGTGALMAARLAFVFAGTGPSALAIQASLCIDLLVVILALVAVVGLFQAAGESERWSLKWLCFPLGGLLAYDLFLYTQTLAVALPGQEYVQARGLLNALAVPLVYVAALRHRAWRKQFTVSRQAALYSIAFIAIGLYLLLVAAVATVIREFPLAQTTELQIGLLFLAILLLALLLSSASARARIKFFVGRHFFARKYDYAHEWRKFMQTLALEEDASPLENRIIRACADLLEVPGGALWDVEQGRARLQATWNYRVPWTTVDRVDMDLFQDTRNDLRCLHGEPLSESPFGEDPSAWVVIPLPLGHELLGVIVLSRPRVRHELDREDEELALLVARQCSIFLAESRASAALEQNKQFARFNRQYAFVAHDIKNIISQLSVMLKNFERHADDPEFQRDTHATVANSVERLQKLVDRLKRLSAGEATTEALEELRVHDIVAAEVASRDSVDGPRVAFTAEPHARDATLHMSKERLTTVCGHLLANAVEATGASGTVRVHLDTVGRDVVLDIVDDGPGMSADFVRERLFAPFHSTKGGGFGVGAYQCREFAREQGGDLEVVSSPGSGTTMRLRLPMVSRSVDEMAAQE